jgi:hypothetical protein
LATPPEPIFSPEEIKVNELKKRKLLDLLASGDGILMAGAGCTATIYPDWLGFVELLNNEAVGRNEDFIAFDPGKEDFLTFADRVKDCIGPDLYYNLIYRSFRQKEKTHEKFHESLCRLLCEKKLKGITTTNYDPVFENALVAVTGKAAEPIWIDSNIEQARIFEFLVSLNGGPVPKRIFHIHGVCHQKDSIVLSESEYRSKYGFKLRQPPATIFEAIQLNGMTQQQFLDALNDYGLVWTIHRKILWSLFATRRLIFIGFSLNDPYFNKMLEFVSKDLHTYDYEMHFLVLRVSSYQEKDRAYAKAKQLKQQFGIETILFEENESNTGLENFVFELEGAVIGETVPEETKVAHSDGQPTEDSEELTKQLIEISKGR